MIKAKIICNRAFSIGVPDRHIFGSFAEHMGRVIYSGIYEPDHPEADEDGFRKDVIKALQEMGVSSIRYPGGNFVSCYNWMDGIGPKNQRPYKRDLAWQSIETNQFGTDEFMKWISTAGTDCILAVNLGTQGVENAVNYLEYVNLPVGTKYSNLRKEYGHEKPYNVKKWCLGNEMDGDWQIGHKTAFEYGRLAAETAKAMKRTDPSIQLIACGSSKSDMPSFPEWDMEILEQVYDVADYLALHQYYGGQEMGTAAFLAQSEDFENYIKTARAAIQIVKAKKRSPRQMYISVDEWGVWALQPDDVTKQVCNDPWQIAPSISEQIYTMEDALLFASMLMTILRNSDIIKIACQSLITNISSCIMTKRGGESWKQTTFYPFKYLSNYAHGKIMKTSAEIPAYNAGKLENIPLIDTLYVLNDKELAVFAVNRSDAECAELETELQGISADHIIEYVSLTSENRKETNEYDHNAVLPANCDAAEIKGNRLTVQLQPLSFNMIRVAL